MSVRAESSVCTIKTLHFMTCNNLSSEPGCFRQCLLALWSGVMHTAECVCVQNRGYSGVLQYNMGQCFQKHLGFDLQLIFGHCTYSNVSLTPVCLHCPHLALHSNICSPQHEAGSRYRAGVTDSLHRRGVPPSMEALRMRYVLLSTLF